MNLADLQRAFQQYVLGNDAVIAERINASEEIPATVRLAIYGDAYRIRLADALAANYPRLQRWLGDAAFADLARSYLDAHPSANPSVRWFGDRLADHLGTQPSSAAEPWLTDLVRWEWAIAAAFDAPDRSAIDESVLATVQAEQWPALRFGFHPSVQVLELTTNATSLFKALSEDAQVPPPDVVEAHDWLIWRPELTPRYRSLPGDEAAALRCALEAGTFSDLCEVLCEWHDPSQVAVTAVRLLKQWIAEVLIVDATVA